MYSIKLDENKYFSGSYATIGGVEGGIDINELPPDMNKSLYYKYDYHDVTTSILVPDIDISTGEQKLDGDNNPLFIEQPVTNSVLEWIFDEDKYNQSLVDDLATLKLNKIKELGSMCDNIIKVGTDIETSNGIEHFSFDESDHDQANIKNAYDIAKATGLSILYHADGQPCRIFTVQEILNIYITMMQYITYNTTLVNMLNTWIRRSTTVEEINSIQYTSVLPEDLQTLMNENLSHAALIIQALNI